MVSKRERKYIIIIIALLVVYFLLIKVQGETPDIAEHVRTISTLIAAVTFWMQLKRTENLNEANFILNLNKQFIDNKAFTDIEHKLEMFAYKVGESTDRSPENLKLDIEIEGKDHQALINYLVYLESFAALVQREVMHLGIVDDLFMYRFFIAVNNPIVQETELRKYAPYYQGCFNLAKKWSKRLREQNRKIPLDQFALCDLPESKE
ncbi:MAG: hypothetical protein IKJ65_08760 [Clostridia bacterium]|nr:hypothetical protein [Clostridia bacterium]